MSMKYIYIILSKNNSKIRLSFYFPWIGIFIGTIFLLLINSIMDGMEREIFSKINKIDNGYKLSSSTEENKIKNYLNSNNIHYSEQLLRDIVVGVDQNYLLAKFVVNKPSNDNNKKAKTPKNLLNNKSSKDEVETPYISIGRGISRKLNLSVGDYVQIFSPLDVKLTTMKVPKASFLVANIYETPVVDFDEIFIFSNDTLFVKEIESEKYFLLNRNIDKTLFPILKETFPSIVIQELVDEYSPLINAIKLEKRMYTSFGYLLIIISSLGLFTTINYTISNKIRSLAMIDLLGYSFIKIRTEIYKMMVMLCSLSTIFAILAIYILIYFNFFDPLIQLLFPKDLFYDFNLSVKSIDCIKILLINIAIIIFSIFIPLKTIDSRQAIKVLRKSL